jgi:hypothetical protein
VVAPACVDEGPHRLTPVEQAFECTNAYGTYGIPKQSSVMCRSDESYPTISNRCKMGSCMGHPWCVHRGKRVEDVH